MLQSCPILGGQRNANLSATPIVIMQWLGKCESESWQLTADICNQVAYNDQ